MSNRFDSRRPYNPSTFEQHQGGIHRDLPESTSYSPDAGPSVSPPYQYYDRYVSPRAGPSYRGDLSYTNTYRNGDTWRPERERTPSYYRPPSPDRYPAARYTRPEVRPEVRPRPTRWVPEESPPRTDRRFPQTNHYETTWRSQRDARDTMAARMFEPSETWKQAHSTPSDHWESPDIRNSRGTQRRMSPPPYSAASNRSWRRTPSPPPANHWDPPETARSDNGGYPPPSRSPSDRQQRSTVQYWDSSRRQSPEYAKPSYDLGHGRLGYRRELTPEPMAPRSARSQSNETDERPVRQSPTRTYHPVSPVSISRRDAYWPEPPTTPEMRPSHEARFTRSNTWGYHSRTPSDSYSAGTRQESVPVSGQRFQHREEDLLPSSHANAAPPLDDMLMMSPSLSRPLHDERPPQEQPLLEPAIPPFQTHQDSIASTPHNELLSRAPSPSPSNTPSSPGVTHAEPPQVIEAPAQPVAQDVPPSNDVNGLPEPSEQEIQPPLHKSRSPTPALDVPPVDGELARTEASTLPEDDVAPPAVLPVDDLLPGSRPGTPPRETGDDLASGEKDREDVATAAEPQTVSLPAEADILTVADVTPIADGAPIQGGDFRDTLRMFVMMRLQNDRQTRDERVGPALHANEAIVSMMRSSQTSEAAGGILPIVEEYMQKGRTEARQLAHVTNVKHSLQARFTQRQADLDEKVVRLRAEYMELHERWANHCAKLDEVAKAGALEEAAASAGRTTRRSLASLGDAVRSDLEMEQIIASLGNEELTDANHLAARNAAVIPDMLTVTPSGLGYLYDDTNNLVENPDDFYAPESGLHDWNEEEKAIFLGKYAEYPKQFGIIADSLPHKTPSQCVTYYYMAKKEIDFRKAVAQFASGKRKRGGKGSGKKRGNALLADILQHDAEFSREHTPQTSGRRARPSALDGSGPSTGSRRSGPPRRSALAQLEHTPGSTPDPDPDARKKRRRVTTARAAAAYEQEGENDDGGDVDKPAKRSRKSRRTRTTESTAASTPILATEEAAPTPPESRVVDQGDSGSRKKAAPVNAARSEEDKAQLISLLGRYGDEIKRVAAFMPSKTTTQISTFYKANMTDIKLDRLAVRASNRSPAPNLANHGGPTFPGSVAILHQDAPVISIATNTTANPVAIVPIRATLDDVAILPAYEGLGIPQNIDNRFRGHGVNIPLAPPLPPPTRFGETSVLGGNYDNNAGLNGAILHDAGDTLPPRGSHSSPFAFHPSPPLSTSPGMMIEMMPSAFTSTPSHHPPPPSLMPSLHAPPAPSPSSPRRHRIHSPLQHSSLGSQPSHGYHPHRTLPPPQIHSPPHAHPYSHPHAHNPHPLHPSHPHAHPHSHPLPHSHPHSQNHTHPHFISNPSPFTSGAQHPPTFPPNYSFNHPHFSAANAPPPGSPPPPMTSHAAISHSGPHGVSSANEYVAERRGQHVTGGMPVFGPPPPSPSHSPQMWTQQRSGGNLSYS